ncbi:MAG: hypothetical protein AMJ69_04650 [Gammaproteobacteria bacterium SG8_47]|nr:MAG: hypothetical protein AMJ69_04650 [Gammaproteobacteria bacterium SG8_47]
MHGVRQRLASTLLEIEAELRRLGWWEEQAPSTQALASQQPFCLDSLRPEQWLQWVLLPRMQAILEQNAPLPGQSGLFVYFEECWRNRGVECAALLALLTRFDELIAIDAAARRH